MKFAAVIDYKADNPKVAEVRPAHRKYLGELKEKGKLVISGPFPETGGALIVYEAESKDEAEALMSAFRKVYARLATDRAARAVLRLNTADEAVLACDRQPFEPDVVARIDGFLVRDGAFPQARRAGGCVFWLHSEVTAWMRSCPMRVAQ